MMKRMETALPEEHKRVKQNTAATHPNHLKLSSKYSYPRWQWPEIQDRNRSHLPHVDTGAPGRTGSPLEVQTVFWNRLWLDCVSGKGRFGRRGRSSSWHIPSDSSAGLVLHPRLLRTGVYCHRCTFHRGKWFLPSTGRPSLCTWPRSLLLHLLSLSCEYRLDSQDRLEIVSLYWVPLPNSSQMNCLYICMKEIARTPPGRMAHPPKRTDSSKPCDRQPWCSALSTRRAPLQNTKVSKEGILFLGLLGLLGLLGHRNNGTHLCSWPSIF